MRSRPSATASGPVARGRDATGARRVSPSSSRIATGSSTRWPWRREARARRREGIRGAGTPTAAGAWGRSSQEILTAASVPLDAGDGEHAPRRRRAADCSASTPTGTSGDAPTRRSSASTRRTCRWRRRASTRSSQTGSARIGCAAVTIRWRRRSRSTRSMPHTVELLLSAVERSTDILTRWYERKRAALGIEQIERYDRARARSVTLRRSPGPTPSTPRARSSTELSPRLGEIARGIFAENRVDAERRPGKDGAIFCAGFPGEHGVFVFLSYIESASGATMLGHEMGHGVHFAVAAAARPWLVGIRAGDRCVLRGAVDLRRARHGRASLHDDRRRGGQGPCSVVRSRASSSSSSARR